MLELILNFPAVFWFAAFIVFQCYFLRHVIIERAALYEQIVAMKRTQRRVAATEFDRLLWRFSARLHPEWKKFCLAWQPGTVVKWHRETLFKFFWRWISRLKGRQPFNAEGVELLRRMAKQNPDWDPSRLRGELQKSGFVVCLNTVKKYLGLRPDPEKSRRRDPNRGPGWMTFLKLHREYIAAMDYFVVYSLGFSPMFVFFVIDHSRRRILHTNVTKHPDMNWVTQQLRDAFPGEHGIRYLIHDNDPVFVALKGFMKNLGIDSKKTAFRSPWMNGIAERFVKTIRQELTNHIIPLNERHLARLVREYCLYYNEDRTHTTLELDSPDGRESTERTSPGAKVVRFPRVRGLHSVYRWENAA